MYKDYIVLGADHLVYFGGFRSGARAPGAFFLRVNVSSTSSNTAIGGRLIKFGD